MTKQDGQADPDEAKGEAPRQPLRIEEYALIGDCRTGALVGCNGAIDWLCWPRFDSGACFAALLGSSDNGSWLLCPASPATRVTRGYRGDTMVLETVFETEDGVVAVIDFMPYGQDASSLVRRVEGRSGRVDMRMHMKIRFDYGSSTPWVTKSDEDERATIALAGPNLVVLRTSATLEGRDKATVSEFVVRAGEVVDFVMTWGESNAPTPAAFDVEPALEETERFWREWAARCQYDGRWRNKVVRSLLTLKALTYAPTGGIVAALTTSLPEQLGGERNWDYRYCWLRDATLTLIALMGGGYDEEAQAWRQWLHRAVAGDPDEMQIMYGIAGERTLVEWTPIWLPGYQGAKPVRIGNAASEQLQLDVFGEVMSAIHIARHAGMPESETSWSMQVKSVDHLATIWDQPDDGIWEVRGPRRNFTHSKVMAWVAIDRAILDAETYGFEAPLERWRALRDTIHADVCEKGFNRDLDSFTQSYGDTALDASLLLIPMVGFLPVEDPRVAGTIAAVERTLVKDGFVLRYRTETGDDGLAPGEGAFLPCSFWLADAYASQGRIAEADALFERLAGLSNDVGLISEEYDTKTQRLVGNFPQAFSHLALIGTALSRHDATVREQRSGMTGEAVAQLRGGRPG